MLIWYVVHVIVCWAIWIAVAWSVPFQLIGDVVLIVICICIGVVCKSIESRVIFLTIGNTVGVVINVVVLPSISISVLVYVRYVVVVAIMLIYLILIWNGVIIVVCSVWVPCCFSVVWYVVHICI